MTQLSLADAWNETAAFVRREAALLFPIAFLLVALPLSAMAALAPRTAQGEMPEAGPWLVILPIALMSGMIGNIAISRLALRPGTSVGEALGRGLRRMPALLGTTLILIAGFVVLAILLALVAALFVPGMGAADPDPQAARRAVLVLALLLAPFVLYFGARLVPITPVAAGEDGGPIAILKRSWALTKGNFWTLLGFILLLTVLVTVLNLAVASVAGTAIVLLAGQPDPGSLSAFLILLVAALLNMLVAVFTTTIVTRVYAQLSGDSTSGI